MNDLEQAFARAVRAITPPRDPRIPMHTFEIRFTYSYPTSTRGDYARQSDQVRIEAVDSASAQKAFNAQFADENQGATLESVTCLQVPGT